MARYQIPAIIDLRDQLLYVPAEARKKQVYRLEQLVREIEPQREYPHDYVFFRITHFRTQQNINANFSGLTLRHDLLRLLLDLSASVDIPASEAGEPVFAMEEAAQCCNVTPRTIARWHNSGLVGMKFIFPDAQKKTGFRQSALEQFIAANPTCTARSRAVTRLSDAEKAQIIKRARALASSDNSLSLSKIAERLSGEFDRSREAIRYTLRRFDRRHPESPIFDNALRNLSEDDMKAIKQLYDRGTPVRSISRNYRRTPSAIYTIINRMQAREIAAEQIEFVHNAEFDAPDADEVILGRHAHPGRRRPSRRLSLDELADAPPYLRHLYETPLLTRQREQVLFRRYNYCKHKIAKLRSQLDSDRPKAALLRKIFALRKRALAVKNEIISANLRLVIGIARRHAGPLTSMAQLISDGNLCLMRAVEKFDYSRGNRFSTYATWALMKNFAKTVPEENYLLNKFRTVNDDALDAVGNGGPEPFELIEDPSAIIREKVLAVLHKLPEREQIIISSRFGLNNEEKPKTLEQIGDACGLTRERVRQLEARALKRLRALLAPEAPAPRTA